MFLSTRKYQRRNVFFLAHMAFTAKSQNTHNTTDNEHDEVPIILTLSFFFSFFPPSSSSERSFVAHTLTPSYNTRSDSRGQMMQRID